MNTMTIDGVTYELILHAKGCTDVPSVICNGKAYIGRKIDTKKPANEPKNDPKLQTSNVRRRSM
jgi:hypothetical protein